ncbi:MAG: DegT/DnrJ/EryC1/StrS family aminotransferase, partial [Rhodocyclaceae bacterium]|nr:DegT/DnrJ/EryC1/StrS family aminotransferase [Rhodocyclaceae bacterium]
IRERQRVAAGYAERLGAVPGLQLPEVPADMLSVWAQYCVLARDAGHRQRILEALKQVGIPTAIYYPRPLHLQRAFSFLGQGPGSYPVAEALCERIFALPMHPYLADADIGRIAAVIASAGAA